MEEARNMLRSVGLLLLRVNLGGTLMAHGYPKLFGGPGKTPPPQLEKALGPNWRAYHEQSGPKGFAAYLESLEVPYPQIGAYASGLAEFLGGAAIVLGFKTRLAALAVLGNLSVAIWKAHWPKGFFGQGGYEFPMALAAEAATLEVAGPGALSIDGICSAVCKADKGKKKEGD
jgi:putative oxidoreductase